MRESKGLLRAVATRCHAHWQTALTGGHLALERVYWAKRWRSLVLGVPNRASGPAIGAILYRRGQQEAAAYEREREVAILQRLLRSEIDL